MIEFIAAVSRYSFLQYALITGTLASVACGIVGSYVVTRRITYVAGGIAHFVLGGMGAAKFFQVKYGLQWLTPINGAIISALIAAMIIGLVSIHRKEREDTIISVIWSVGMAVGILFISQTPGYNRDLLSYLFGNILMVSPNEILMIGILDTLIVVLGILFYNQLLAVCFDEEFAALRGINVKLFYLMLLGMTALTVVLLITVVGIIMVIALLTIPAAIASLFSRTLFQTMIIAVILSMLFTVSGLAISYGPDLPAGATIIILACVSYIIAALISKIAKPNTA